MTRAAQFIDYQVPNEHTQVGRMIKSITSRDPAIVSAITHIQGSEEQRNNFEKAADFLLLTANKFTADQKGELKELRASRDKNKNTISSEVAVLKQQIDALESRLIAAIATSRDTTNNDTESQKKGPLSNPLNQRTQS